MSDTTAAPAPYASSTFDWDAYRRYRPEYPEHLFRAIFDFHKLQANNDWLKSLDVGCGPGTVTEVLATRFAAVVGTDAFSTQLDAARQRLEAVRNVTFFQTSGEDLSHFDAETIDMITYATSIHWMDLPRCVSEASRVLKSGGTFAAWTYQPLGILSPAPLNELVRGWLYDAFKLKLSSAPSPEMLNMLQRLMTSCRSDLDNIAFSADQWRDETRLNWNHLGDAAMKSMYPESTYVDNRGVLCDGYHHEYTRDSKLSQYTYDVEEFIGFLRSLDLITPEGLDDARKALEVATGGEKITQQFSMTLVMASKR